MSTNHQGNSHSQKSEFPTANRQIAQRQLELLGYKPEDKIYLRFFYPSDDPRKGADKGRKASRLNWKEIETYQRQGRGVYFVVNGGGHKDEDVTVGRAIFCEHDHLAKDIQRDLWKTLNLPEPTFQVDTGGKSIHSFWVFVEPIPIPDWCELQKDLLEYVDGDRSIKNPSRVMRLAGCWHISFKSKVNPPLTPPKGGSQKSKVRGKSEVRNQKSEVGTQPTPNPSQEGKLEVEYNQSRIISESGCTYSYSQLRSLIPSSVNSDPKVTNVRTNGHKPTLITEQEVPLYQFLTKDDRALIDAGAVNGTRNSSGAKLARNLIGTSSRLDYLGIRFTGEPYQLFLDYCDRCPNGNGWNEREWESIWKSAQSNNPTASLTDEALINCALAWVKKSVNSYQLPVTSEPKITNGQSNGQEPPLITDNWSLVTVLDELINLELPPSKLTAKLNQIAQRAYLPVPEVRKLYSERIAELELADSRESTAAELEQLRSATSSSLDLSTVIPEPLAEPIKKLAHWLNLRPECYLMSLLTGISTLNDTETELVLHRDWDFTVTPNLFAAIVSPSAQKKSPILKAMVTKPLRRLQRKARQEYKLAMQQYETDLARYELLKRNKEPGLEKEFPNGRPVEPRMKLYYFTNATGEGMLNQVAAHPDQGILYLKDELAGVFKSTNQYRNGRGSDEEDILSYYDGTGGTVLRANGTQADLDGLLLGILGSIQPGVLQKLLGDFEDSNGNWARFMFVWQPLAASSMVPDGGKFDLTELIAWLYEELDKTSALAPKQYFLTPDAFKLFCEAYNSLERKRIDPATTPAMQNVWGKSEGRIGKLAINLHRIEAVFLGQLPSPTIGRDTIRGALALSYFSAQQVQAIYTMLGSENSLPPMLAKVLDIAERKGDWVTAKDVRYSCSSKNRPRPETVRQWFKELVELGIGVTQGEGRQLKFQFSGQRNQKDQKETSVVSTQKTAVQGLQAKETKETNFESFTSRRQDEKEKKEKDENLVSLVSNPQDAVTEPDTPETSVVSSWSPWSLSEEIPNGSSVKIHNAEIPNSDPPIIDWNELLEAMDKEMKRLCWGVEEGRAYLQHKYHKKSRQALTDSEALEFYQFLTKRKTGYLVGERVVVSHADPELNGQLAKIISVKLNNILEIEFADHNRQICEVSALHVTLSNSELITPNSAVEDTRSALRTPNSGSGGVL